jgi:hypothetical protein
MRNRALINYLLSLLWLLTGILPSPADPLDHWQWRYPRPQGNTLRAVTYGNGQFVAVGDYGTIITSGDGYNWTNQTYGKFPGLCGVGYSAGTFAAVGVSGTILTSSNGVDWVQQISNTSNTLWAVAGNPTFPADEVVQFLAVGESGIVVTCTDISSWTSTTQGANALYGIKALGNDAFYVVGNGGTILYRTGTNWVSNPSGTTGPIYAVAARLGMYAAGGDLWDYYGNWILYSYGSGWAKQNFDGTGFWFPSAYFAVRGMDFGSNRFIAVGDTGQTLERNYPGVLLTSEVNPSSWTELPSSTSENSLKAVTHGNGLFVAVGDAGAILVSSNGVNWTEITGYHRSAITAIACGEDLCIVSAQVINRAYAFLRFPDFTTLVSSNGVDWIVSTTNLPPMSSLVAAGRFFAGISGTCIYTTTNGFDWSTNCLASPTLRGLGHSKDLFFAVGDGGAVYTSSDGLSWSNHSITASGNFNCAVYGNGLYIAAGSIAATSTDGISWSLCPTNPPATLRRIV